MSHYFRTTCSFVLLLKNTLSPLWCRPYWGWLWNPFPSKLSHAVFMLNSCVTAAFCFHKLLHTHSTKVNHLSHFLLTLELLPSLLETASSTGDGRIIFVSSGAHSWGTFNPENMNREQNYGRGRFYGNSKLYNVSTNVITLAASYSTLANF